MARAINDELRSAIRRAWSDEPGALPISQMQRYEAFLDRLEEQLQIRDRKALDWRGSATRRLP